MGIKHCGKSTQGKLLATELTCPFYDTDDVMETVAGKSPRQLYTEGVSVFRQAESAACRSVVSLVEQAGGSMLPEYVAVIATGGGICDNEAALNILRPAGIFIFLETAEKTAADRIVREAVCTPDGKIENIPSYIAKENPHTLDDVRASFHQFFIGRVKKYRSLCDFSVQMGAVPKEENLRVIIDALHR